MVRKKGENKVPLEASIRTSTLKLTKRQMRRYLSSRQSTNRTRTSVRRHRRRSQRTIQIVGIRFQQLIKSSRSRTSFSSSRTRHGSSRRHGNRGNTSVPGRGPPTNTINVVRPSRKSNRSQRRNNRRPRCSKRHSNDQGGRCRRTSQGRRRRNRPRLTSTKAPPGLRMTSRGAFSNVGRATIMIKHPYTITTMKRSRVHGTFFSVGHVH